VDRHNRTNEEIVASNSAIHEELLEVIERNWQRQD